MDVKADELVLKENQLTDIEQIKPIIFAPDGSGYYSIGKSLAEVLSIRKTLK
jgi:hypothetical protein